MHKKLLVTAYFVIAALLQTLAGNFPLSFFAFPLNVIVAVIWIYSLWRLYKEGNKLPLTRFLLSSRTSVLSILLLIWLSACFLSYRKQKQIPFQGF